MSSSRVVICVLLLSMISMQGIHARGLRLEPEKVGKALKKEGKILATIEKEDGTFSTGEGSITSSSSPQAIYKWKSMRRQARSVKHVTETEGAFDSSENDVVEDVVVMDYAQPHRKPPIHNEKS